MENLNCERVGIPLNWTIELEGEGFSDGIKVIPNASSNILLNGIFSHLTCT